LAFGYWFMLVDLFQNFLVEIRCLPNYSVNRIQCKIVLKLHPIRKAPLTQQQSIIKMQVKAVLLGLNFLEMEINRSSYLEFQYVAAKD